MPLIQTILIRRFPLCVSLYDSLSKSNDLQGVCFEKSMHQDYWGNSIEQQGHRFTSNQIKKLVEKNSKNYKLLI